MSRAKNIDESDFFALLGNVFRMITPSWEALKLNIGTFIGLYLVPVILSLIAIPFLILPALNDGGFISSLIASLGIAALVVIACLFLPALTLTQLASVRGQKIGFNDAFEQGKKFTLRYIGLAILTALAIIFGLILFIIPGVLAAFFLSLAAYILIDKNLGVIDSMKASYELVKDHWEIMLCVVIVGFIIALPRLVPIIGEIISLALSVAYFCLTALVYNKLY